MNDLVSKFEKVKIKQSSLLPSEDIEFCKQQQQGLDGTLAQLKEWHAFFDEKNKTEVNPAYELEKEYGYRSGNESLVVKDKYKYSHTADKDNPDFNIYDRYKYTVKYSLLKVADLRSTAIQVFINRILGYFKDKYHVELKDLQPERKEENNYIKYEAVIEYIRITLGHLDFKMVAIDKAIQNLQKKLNYTRIELKGKQVFFHSYLWYRGYGVPDFDHEFMNAYWSFINNAIAIWETDSLQDADWSLGSAIRGKEIDFEREYTLINSTRIVGVRFYKNRKLLLKFLDAQAAKDFVNRFQLSLKSE